MDFCVVFLVVFVLFCIASFVNEKAGSVVCLLLFLLFVVMTCVGIKKKCKRIMPGRNGWKRLLTK